MMLLLWSPPLLFRKQSFAANSSNGEEIRWKMTRILVVILTWLQIKWVKLWKLLCWLIVELKSLQLPTRCLFQKVVSPKSCMMNSVSLRLAVDVFHECFLLHCKNSRIKISCKNFSPYEENIETFSSRIVTGDETWVHYGDPSTQQESMQWKHKTSSAPVKFRVQPSAGKVMATVFWDCHGILLVEYMAHKSTITADVHVNTLKSLRDAIKEKRCGLLSHSMMLLHDNALVHKANKAQAAIAECGF